MDYDGRVVFKIDGDDSGLKKAINGAESSLSGLKSTLVKLGLGAILTKGMNDAVKATNTFESSLAKASTLFGDVAVDTDNLTKKILDLSTATGQSADSIGNSLYNALSAGVSVTEDMGEAMTFLESATKLSVAGFTDVDTAVTATAKVMNAYGMSMEDASRIGEVLMETQNLGITTVNELGGALATVTPMAASFGVSFEQVGASLALMTKKGTDTATATTQLRGMIQELGQDGTQASKNLQKAFERTGKEYKNFAEYMKDPENNLQTAIQLLAEEADIAGLSLSDMFGNVRAGVGALQLASDKMEVFNTFLNDMEGDSRLVEEAYGKMMDTRANKWKKMREQFKNITISITNSDTVQTILDNLTGTAQGFLDNLEEWLPEILTKLDAFYHKTRLVFKYLQGEYERSFLNQVVSFTIDVVWDELKKIIDMFKEGNIFGAVATLVGDYFLVKVSFELLSGAMSSLTSAFSSGTKFGSVGIFIADALLLYVKFQSAQKGDTSWTKFAEDVGLALVGALGTLLITGNPIASGLMFGVILKLTDLQTTDDVQKLLDEFADPNATFGSKAQAVLDYSARKFTALADLIGKITGLGAGNRNAFESAVEKRDAKKWASDYAKANDLPSDLGINTYKILYVLSAQFDKKAKDIWGKKGENLGQYLTMGLEQGLFKWDAEAKVYVLCDELNTALEDAEGIHSPSKVWEKYGEFLAEGLEQGLTGEAAEKYAKESIQQIYDWLEEEVAKGNMGLEEAFGDVDLINSENLVQKMSDKLKDAVKTEEPPTPEEIIPEEVETKLTFWQKFWQDAKTAPKEIAESLSKDVSKGFDDFIANVTEAEARTQIWTDAFQNAFDSIGTSLEDLGQSIAEGEADWGNFAKAGILAIATLLEALGKELAAEAIAALVAENYPKAILAGAGSATAFTSAGLVKGWANSFERGGIVGGSGITGDRHVVFANAGELILSKAQQGAIASQLSTRGGSNITIAFNGQVFGDQQSISEYVYDGIRNAQREGAIPSWQQ